MHRRIDDWMPALWRTLVGPFAPEPIRYGTDECTIALRAATRLGESKNHPFIGTEHILFGVLSTPDGAAVRILASLGLDAQRIGRDIGAWLERGDPGPPATRRLFWSPRAREALEAGLREARAAGRGFPVGSEYVLLGLLGDSNGVKAEWLRRHGVTAARLREAALHSSGFG